MKKILVALFILSLGFSSYSDTSTPSSESIKAITKRVADWQVDTFHEHGKYRALAGNKITKYRNRTNNHDLDWENGALYAGMNQWRKVADEPEKYTEFLRMIGQRNQWKLHERPYHADDHTVGQFYLSFYEDFGDPITLRPTKKHFDWILENQKNGSLEWMTKEMRESGDHTDCHDRWGWCDALFMAPPVWARLAKLTGDNKYLEFMDKEYHATYDLLWDKEDHLFWRDSSFFPKREKNGRKLYWARGNGWVFGGLALMIPDLPESWEGRQFYVDLFKEMAVSLKNCQREDGTWSMGLLGGVEGYPIKETSGTSFYAFGLSWGINSGILDAEEYQDVVFNAWNALTDCVREDGLLGYVQPVGAAPGDSYPNYTEVYGVGAFLAAGSEIYKMVGGDAPAVPSVTESITFMEDGGWCWYQDPRAIIKNGKLVIGGLSGQNGDVKVAVYDLESEKDLGTVVLHEKFQRDDHNVPALYARPDGSILAMYARHGTEKRHHYRISDPKDYTKWGNAQTFEHTYDDKRGVTYMNLYKLEEEGLLYNFFRDGEHFNPSYITSSDDGETWGNYTHFITHDVGGRQRPYARYLQRDENTVGISFTDAHPRAFGNSLYYADFKDGAFYRVDGSKIKDLSEGPLMTSEAEKIYKGSETKQKPKGWDSVHNAAWTCAATTDEKDNPVLGYSVFYSHEDHRYRIASWNGDEWVDREIAFAGKCLYDRESSYTGLMAFDPTDASRVYISTDVDPQTGADLGGKHEIYTANVGLKDTINTIVWEKVTANSEERQIRPLVVSGEGYTVLLWLSGPWKHFVNYDSNIVGQVIKTP